VPSLALPFRTHNVVGYPPRHEHTTPLPAGDRMTLGNMRASLVRCYSAHCPWQSSWVPCRNIPGMRMIGPAHHPAFNHRPPRKSEAA
jgi:hypothetical protein